MNVGDVTITSSNCVNMQYLINRISHKTWWTFSRYVYFSSNGFKNTLQTIMSKNSWGPKILFMHYNSVRIHVRRGREPMNFIATWALKQDLSNPFCRVLVIDSKWISKCSLKSFSASPLLHNTYLCKAGFQQ